MIALASIFGAISLLALGFLLDALRRLAAIDCELLSREEYEE